MTSAPPEQPPGNRTKAAPGNGFSGSMDALAAKMNFEYKGRLHTLLGARQISNWQTMQRMPRGCGEPFPGPRLGGSWDLGAVRAWIENWLVIKPGDAAGLAPETQEVFSLDDQIKQEKLEILQEEKRSKKLANDREYMLKSDHAASLQRCAAVVRSHVRRMAEEAVPASFREWLLRRTDLTPQQVEEIAGEDHRLHLAGMDNLQKSFSEYTVQKKEDDE